MRNQWRHWLFLTAITLTFFGKSGRTFAQLLPGIGYSPTNVPIASWSFYDPTNWTDDTHHAPISFTNLSYSYLGNGSTLVVGHQYSRVAAIQCF